MFQGQGTWLIEQAVPEAKVVCLDVTFAFLKWRSKRANYIQQDFSLVDWSGYDLASAVALFDDHQNAMRRLREMHWVGLHRAIFEDNYPATEGDCYSLRQILAGSGHPQPQMSARYRKLKNRFRDTLELKRLQDLGTNQSVIAPPNLADRANLLRRLAVYHEIPPVFLPPRHSAWRTAFEGNYASKPPLLDKPPDHFDGAYGFICYVEIA